ncbi:MAG: MBL fold metallo-hydrolase [Hyphomicrobiales bacterium]
MEITWLGRTCFRLKGRERTVVTDPCPPDSGFQLGKLSGDILTLSRRDDPAYSYVKGVGGDPFILDAPGEYEVGGVLVTGIATKGPGDSRNVVFIIEIDGMRIAHLGVISQAGVAHLDDVKGVDILLLPAGNGNSIGGAVAADLMTTIDAKLCIPMNFRANGETMEGIETLERFLKETSARPEPEQKITITRSQLPSELSVRVLEPHP